jgi:hypothetical protein
MLEDEGFTTLYAIQLAAQRGWNFVVFESGHQTLVNYIVTDSKGKSEFNSTYCWTIVSLSS